MEDVGFSTEWPAPLKEAWWKLNRFQHRRRLLEANFIKADYDQFDSLMLEIERVQQALFDAHSEFETLYRQHYPPALPPLNLRP